MAPRVGPTHGVQPIAKMAPSASAPSGLRAAAPPSGCLPKPGWAGAHDAGQQRDAQHAHQVEAQDHQQQAAGDAHRWHIEERPEGVEGQAHEQ